MGGPCGGECEQPFLLFLTTLFPDPPQTACRTQSLCVPRSVRTRVVKISAISIGFCTFVDADYACQLRALIEDWRAEFINSPPDAPFLVNGAYRSMCALDSLALCCAR